MDPDLLVEPEDPGTGLPLWANLLMAGFLVTFSALFSGLTLGLMSLDKHGLEILMKGGDDFERRNAGQGEISTALSPILAWVLDTLLPAHKSRL